MRVRPTPGLSTPFVADGASASAVCTASDGVAAMVTAAAMLRRRKLRRSIVTWAAWSRDGMRLVRAEGSLSAMAYGRHRRAWLVVDGLVFSYDARPKIRLGVDYPEA